MIPLPIWLTKQIGVFTLLVQTPAYKGKTNGNIRFETTWFEKERNTFVPIAATSPLNYTPGVFTFWLAAADHNRADRNHVVKYDVEEVKVKIAEGKPFQIQNFDNGSWEQNRTYNGGQLLTLHWQVDENIFGKDSKVRILLSDDSGKTYKYVLKDIADNNGVCDVILPNINIGTTNGHFGKRRGQGVIKIEVIDGLAFALSCTKPYHVGGFMIDKNKNTPTPLALVASSLPAQHITVACANAIPATAKIETQGGCGRVTQAIAQEETNKKCDNYYTLKRTYTFSDECNTTVSFEQFITVKDDKAPVFVGLLPNDVSIEEGAALPEAKVLTAKDNCAGELQVTPSVSKANNKVLYMWKATDSCGNSIVHTQTISINPKPQISTPTVSTPTVSTPTVSTPTVTTPTVSTPTVTTPTVSSPTQGIIIYNGVSTADPANYFRIENTDTDQPISVVIFDEMGLKVYENNNYGKTEVFRGMANVGTIIGGRKALAGTYFYIITYYKNGQLAYKKGYLYVR